MCLSVCHCQVEPHAQIPRCVEGIGDGTVKSDRSVEVLHHLGFGRTISCIEFVYLYFPLLFGLSVSIK